MLNMMNHFLHSPGFGSIVSVKRWRVSGYIKETGLWNDAGSNDLQILMHTQKADKTKYPDIKCDANQELITITAENRLLTTNEDSGQRADWIMQADGSIFEVKKSAFFPDANSVNLGHCEAVAIEIKKFQGA